MVDLFHKFLNWLRDHFSLVVHLAVRLVIGKDRVSESGKDSDYGDET